MTYDLIKTTMTQFEQWKFLELMTDDDAMFDTIAPDYKDGLPSAEHMTREERKSVAEEIWLPFLREQRKSELIGLTIRASRIRSLMDVYIMYLGSVDGDDVDLRELLNETEAEIRWCKGKIKAIDEEMEGCKYDRCAECGKLIEKDKAFHCDEGWLCDDCIERRYEYDEESEEWHKIDRSADERETTEDLSEWSEGEHLKRMLLKRYFKVDRR